MSGGFIKVSAITPELKVADTVFNREKIIECLDAEFTAGTKIAVFPELALSGYSCGDLFFQDALRKSVKHELGIVKEYSSGQDTVIFLGIPWEFENRLYNALACIWKGKLLGIVPKVNISAGDGFKEARYFTPGNPQEEPVFVDFFGEKVLFGCNIIFSCKNIPQLRIAAELSSDLELLYTPGTNHAAAGAILLINAGAMPKLIGSEEYRDNLVKAYSAKLKAAYICANAGQGESTQDFVFAGHNIIAENGKIIAESNAFENTYVRTDIDMELLASRRSRWEEGKIGKDVFMQKLYKYSEFELNTEEGCNYAEKKYRLDRVIDAFPFIPDDEEQRSSRCREIMAIQSAGLKKRLEHIGIRKVVLGISGGLDSTLALLVCVKTFEKAAYDKKGIIAITMPGFGTTDRTYHNACELTKKLGAGLEEISIVGAMKQHFEDIGHDISSHNIIFENAQARERTQILMDFANKEGALVVGTGDLSELALGWATYNGDHMSMYGVNGSIPKTLIRYLIEYYAKEESEKHISDILKDILDTPVSPELLPAKGGKIAQKTEDLVGPYELHDFFLYHVIRNGLSPSSIYYRACAAFEKKYDKETIYKWLNLFYKRFFTQQFKRSCLPDGAGIGSVSVSPRTGLHMPSDAIARVWIEELATIKESLKWK